MNSRSTLPSSKVAHQSSGRVSPVDSAPQSIHRLRRASPGREIDHRNAAHSVANSRGVAQRTADFLREGSETNMRGR